MLFSKKPTIILYLKSNALDLINVRTNTSVRLAFPPKIVDNQDIVDVNAFEKSLASFFDQYVQRKQQALLILSEEILFEKKVSNDSQKEVEAFYRKVPFDPEQTTKTEIKSDKFTIIIATNHDFYNPIENLYQKLFGELIAILPISLFEGVSGKNDLSEVDVSIILKDFSQVQKVVGGQQVTKRGGGMIIFGGLAVLAIVIISISLYLLREGFRF